MLPDAGTFWYRPHINETVQLEKGLYGALVVRGHLNYRYMGASVSIEACIVKVN